MTNAAPIPCSARPTMSARGVVAIPQPIEATVKKRTPTRNTRFRPNWSPSEPPTRIRALENNAYASITHWTSVMLAWRSV